MNTTKSAPVNRELQGPFDHDEVQENPNQADFGAIRFVPIPDVEVRLEIDEQSQRVLALQFEVANSNIQVQAYAAPKSEGLWHSVRAQIEQSVQAQGGQTEERLGSFGPELLAKLPLLDDKGSQVGHRFARFIGVDGPRWFLRGMIGGAAINDPAAASQVDQVFRNLVVYRGNEPVPPRELLTLQLPAGVIAPPRKVD